MRRHLLNSTWSGYVSGAPLRVATTFVQGRQPRSPMPAHSGRSRSAAIVLARSVSVPPLDPSDVSEIEGELPTLITRHFNKDGRVPGDERSLQELVLAGSYHFSTIFRYRPADRRLNAGRLGDLQEGTQREVFRSRSGLYNASLEGGTFTNVRIEGFDDPIAIEYTVNDYCSCASIGDFSHERAAALRSKGNDDLNYYVVYDLAKLREAISSILAENGSALKVISKAMVYGEKDRVWTIEDNYQHQEQRDHLSLWLGTTFVKSCQYQHEEEIRLILSDPAKVGVLSTETAPIAWVDERIARAIVSHGPF